MKEGSMWYRCRVPERAVSRNAFLYPAPYSVGGEDLLYTTLDMGAGQPKLSLKAQCFESQGRLLWEEEVKVWAISGGSGVADSLLKKLEKALEPRIGKEGLPVADAAALK